MWKFYWMAWHVKYVVVVAYQWYAAVKWRWSKVCLFMCNTERQNRKHFVFKCLSNAIHNTSPFHVGVFLFLFHNYPVARIIPVCAWCNPTRSYFSTYCLFQVSRCSVIKKNISFWFLHFAGRKPFDDSHAENWRDGLNFWLCKLAMLFKVQAQCNAVTQ